MQIAKDTYYVGVDDHELDLFEGQYIIPNGVSYNSYVIVDEKVAVLDSVDADFGDEWLGKIAAVLDGRAPDYLVVQHAEPDHSTNVVKFMDAYPNAQVVSSAKAFTIMSQFYGTDFTGRSIEVKEGDTLELGTHTLQFIGAPMVHWPEVIMTYDPASKVFFSADAFGKFGALDYDDPEGWACEARRYYFGIVGKFGKQVQALLKKVAPLDIETICSLHGPVLDSDLQYYLDTYDTWSSYGVESEGIAIAYCSAYGHTAEAARELAALLEGAGCPKVAASDIMREDVAEVVEDAFRYGTLVLAAPTINGDVFPAMKEFIIKLADHAYQNRRVAIVENGSWAPGAARAMRALLAEMKDVEVLDTHVLVKGALNDESRAQLEALARELMA
jgi:flavorubredoxin